MEHDPYHQHCSDGDNEDPEEDKGDVVYEESDEDEEEVIDEEAEEDPEEEIYEEFDEDREDIIEEESEEDPEEEITEESDEEEQAVENSRLSSLMSDSMDIKDLRNELNEHPEEERGKKEVQETELRKVTANDDRESKQKQHGGSTQKHRLSRWDHKQEEETSEIDGKSKKRKTRWDSNDSQNGLLYPSGFVNPLELLMDPKIISLKVKLMEINKKLQSSEIYDERPAAERSPSPEPIYNNLGIRINTRDARIRKKLMNDRKHVMSKLAANTHMAFKSPTKHTPIKLVKKLFVPEKEYPTYNFIGLILGPKGNTQKKMEKETGAKIFLRGKGSGESEDEDLHVRVEADNQEALDAAALMIERLLIPVEDRNNDHKRAQLAELAKLRGTCIDNNICNLCKEKGHRKFACPLQNSTFKACCCDMCGSFGHSTSNCKTLQGSPGLVSNSVDKSNKEVDPANLYVGYLSSAIHEKRLKELFLPFGRIINTAVVKDQTTGLSTGYGFVKFENSSDAAAAVTYMNGYKIDGKMLAVRVAGKKPVPIPAVQSNILGQPSCSNEPVISMLPGVPFATMNKESLCFPSSSTYFGHNINASRTEALNTPPPYVMSSTTDPRATNDFSSGYDFCDKVPSSLPNSVSQFPGHPDYVGSKFKSYFTSPAMNETERQMPETDKRSGSRLAYRFP